MEPLSEYRAGVRAVWGSGDYDRMARTEGLYVTGEELVRSVDVTAATSCWMWPAAPATPPSLPPPPAPR